MAEDCAAYLYNHEAWLEHEAENERIEREAEDRRGYAEELARIHAEDAEPRGGYIPEEDDYPCAACNRLVCAGCDNACLAEYRVSYLNEFCTTAGGGVSDIPF